MKNTYQLGDIKLSSADPSYNAQLARCYHAKIRPLCLCLSTGIQMYIARVNGKYIIKRMPNSGRHHSPACDHYEPPLELSGLGQVAGSAIQEDPDEGTTSLKLDYSLSKSSGRIAPIPGDTESDSVKTDGNKLSLRATLHYLWEDAGFNRWSPSMAGKRNWYVIRKYLLNAASDKTAKGMEFSEILYIPETFNSEHKQEIVQRRISMFSKIITKRRNNRRLMILIGEVKEITQSRYGHKIIVKHVPDAHFMLNDDLHKRLLKRFDIELGLWDALDGSHLIVIGTFGVGPTGIASLDEVALMVVTENWIPFESTYDKLVLDALTENHRRFVKGLRYNLPSFRPLACAVVSDTLPSPTALYILPPGSSKDYTNAMEALIEESSLPSWRWDAGTPDIPPLPP